MGRGSRRRRAWTLGQSQQPGPGVSQVLPEKHKAMASFEGHLLRISTAPPPRLNIPPSPLCSKTLGAHTQFLIAQTPQVPIKEPSCPLLPKSDLGAPCPLRRPPSGLSLTDIWCFSLPGSPGCPRTTSFCWTLSPLQNSRAWGQVPMGSWAQGRRGGRLCSLERLPEGRRWVPELMAGSLWALAELWARPLSPHPAVSNAIRATLRGGHHRRSSRARLALRTPAAQQKQPISSGHPQRSLVGEPQLTFSCHL